MTIILFLIDTSGSMNQRAHIGTKPTLLDIAKETVERFIKVRQRDARGGDRYMLLTFDDVPNNIKAGWKESLTVFMNELKNLSATGVTNMNTAIRNAFDYLHINRMQSGIDTFGQGRCPYYVEVAHIILLTDGSKYLTTNSVKDDLIIPASHCPGSEYTIEPFRWDQRFFSIVLRFSGVYKQDQQVNNITNVISDNSPINSFCENSGGRSYCVTSKGEITWSLENMAAKMLQTGVFVKFEKFGPDPPMIIPTEDDRNNLYDPNDRSWQSSRNFLLVKNPKHSYHGHLGNWPIPESYCPDLTITNLPPRSAHPVIKFTCTNSEPTVIENLPFDKYELEPSPLTSFILSRKQPSVAWQVFVANSQRNSELGQPFGYLKASTNLTCVNLFVLPYNYPMLLPLLEELFRGLQGKPTREWKQQFENYLKIMPPYYSGHLRRAINKMGANNLVHENYDIYVNQHLQNIIKKPKALAKAEFDRLTSLMGQPKQINIEWPRISINHSSLMNLRKSSMAELYCSNPSLKRTFAKRPSEFQDFNGFMVLYKDKSNSENKATFYRNASDIPRQELLNQVFKLRKVFFQKHLPLMKLMEEDQIFNLPIGQMGNYQEYLKKKPTPLREIEAAPTRQHMFGNPFKLDKKNLMMIDETDIEMNNGGNSSGRSPKRQLQDSFLRGAPQPKRKPGPLPKDFVYSRSRSPSPLPMSPQQAMYNNNHQDINSLSNVSPTSSPTPYMHPSFDNNIQYFNSYHSTNNESMFHNGNNAISNMMNTDTHPKTTGAFSSPPNSIFNRNQQQHPKNLNNNNKFTDLNQIMGNNGNTQFPLNHNPALPVQMIPNGNLKMMPSPMARPFQQPQMLNGGQPSSYSFDDANRKFGLSDREQDLIKKAFFYVRNKKKPELIELIKSQKEPFAGQLLDKTMSFAERLEMTNFVQTLRSYFGDRRPPDLRKSLKKKPMKLLSSGIARRK